MLGGDTIVALSSGAVPSGVAVIRLSGPKAGAIVSEIHGKLPPPRRLTLSPMRFQGVTLDTGLIAWMPGPHSFTGEDCAELQVHGSPAGVRAILRQITSYDGIRPAEAGEFTRRAFENGKLDLVEAEGLGDLLVAETENQRALAHHRLEGGLTARLEGWRDRILDLRAEIEAQLDFSDEGDVGDLDAKFEQDVGNLRRDIAAVIGQVTQGRIIRSGYRVVLAGPPNAGKSSLLNRLARSDVAIVSDEAGTTRDLKEVPLDLDGQLIVLIDSAGIRETQSKAEAMGIDRAKQAMEGADLVLWLQASDQAMEPAPEGLSVLTVGTKSDLGAVNADLSVSATTGDGLDALVARLKVESGAADFSAADVLVSHERDRFAIGEAERELATVAELLGDPELAAERLRRAGAALERLLGRIDTESVLDHLFANFCIGK